MLGMISGDYHNPLLPHRARGPRRSGLCRCLVALSQLASLPLRTIAITGDTGILLMAYHVYKLFFFVCETVGGTAKPGIETASCLFRQDHLPK